MAARIPRASIVALAWALLTGCAATLERSNRFFYRVNEGLDRAVAKPVSRIYQAITPKPLEVAISNFLDNLSCPETILNDLLQGKPAQAVRDLNRMLVNSTAGLLGFGDPASQWGLERHEEDFGQTLGVWGVGQGPYLVLPLYGPSTLRDAPAIPFGAVTAPLFYFAEEELAWTVGGLGLVDRRVRAEDDLRARDEAAIDPYVFTREAYLQRRVFLIHDGDPPTPTDELDQLLMEAEED